MQLQMQIKKRSLLPTANLRWEMSEFLFACLPKQSVAGVLYFGKENTMEDWGCHIWGILSLRIFLILKARKMACVRWGSLSHLACGIPMNAQQTCCWRNGMTHVHPSAFRRCCFRPTCRPYNGSTATMETAARSLSLLDRKGWREEWCWILFQKVFQKMVLLKKQNNSSRSSSSNTQPPDIIIF